MRLDVTWINRSVEMLDGSFGPDRHAQYQAVGHLYNKLLGPVTRVNVLRPDVTDLPLFTSSCQHSSVSALFPDLVLKQAIADSVIIPGGGKGIDAQAAFIGGLGEIAERLLGVLHFSAVQDLLEFATYKELVARGRRALGPQDLPLFAEEQYADPRFSYQPFQADTPLRWLDGIDLLTGDPVAVPAQVVLLYYKHHPEEARIAYPTTGGLAFHPQPRRAMLHGLFEVIERDAINTRWYGQVPPRRVIVDLSGLRSEAGSRWPRRWSTADIPEVEVYLNDTDLPVPVFTTLAVDRSRTKRALLGGGGADSSRLRALSQSLFELGQTRTSLKYYQSIGFKEIRANSKVSEMTDFFDTAIYYGYAENLHCLDWYRETTETVHWNDIVDHSFVGPEDTYQAALGWAKEAQLTPIAFDFSGACWPGVSVAKVLVPELTQACLPSHPYLGHPRFFNGPLAAESRRRSYEDLNPNPVPFP
jgi:ribosomal protein S12 methylthiotransferase accessory factor